MRDTDATDDAGCDAIGDLLLGKSRTVRVKDGVDVGDGDDGWEIASEVEDLCDANRVHPGGSVGHGCEHVRFDELHGMRKRGDGR